MIRGLATSARKGRWQTTTSFTTLVALTLSLGSPLVGCADPDDPLSASQIDARYGEVDTSEVCEPYGYSIDPSDPDDPGCDPTRGFTAQNYEVQGQTSIAALRALFDAELEEWKRDFPGSWDDRNVNNTMYLLSPLDPHPLSEGRDPREDEWDCDTVPYTLPPLEVDELPAVIEGVVTLHPRYFEKTSYCGSDERYYGSYFIQDATGGILVLKDSRIADFTVGQRVSLRVRGLYRSRFADRETGLVEDVNYVMIHDQEQVLTESRQPIYYQSLGFPEIVEAPPSPPQVMIPVEGQIELAPADTLTGEVGRVRGRVASEATSSNFNEICLVPVGAADDSACDPACVEDRLCRGQWLVSLDREIGQREPHPISRGDVVEFTGPVVNSFGLRILIAQQGQITFIEDN